MHEAVAEAAHIDNMDRGGGKPLPQSPYNHFNGLDACIVVFSKDLIEKTSFGDDLPCFLDQGKQQCVFARRKMERLAAELEDAGMRIELQRPASQ